jgi:hypothetical protein
MLGFYIFVKSFERAARQSKANRHARHAHHEWAKDLRHQHREAKRHGYNSLEEWEAADKAEKAAEAAQRELENEQEFYAERRAQGWCMDHPVYYEGQESTYRRKVEDCEICNPPEPIDYDAIVNQATALLLAGTDTTTVAGYVSRQTGLDETTALDLILNASAQIGLTAESPNAASLDPEDNSGDPED